MTMKNRCFTFALVGVAAVVAVGVAVAFTQDSKNQQPPAFELPPGWTMEDMQTCMEAGTPGPMHAYLVEGAGVWHGKTKMWMAPGAEAVESTCITTVTPMMDGRFVKVEVSGDMPGMGPFNGFGIYGYDNVAEQFQLSWIDNCGTGIMTGTGELSSDGTTLTWTCTYHCPLTKKPTTMREIDRRTSQDTATLEMYSVDPKSGKEFKTMEITSTRK
jgi:hypothetical protein